AAQSHLAERRTDVDARDAAALGASRVPLSHGAPEYTSDASPAASRGQAHAGPERAELLRPTSQSVTDDERPIDPERTGVMAPTHRPHGEQHLLALARHDVHPPYHGEPGARGSAGNALHLCRCGAGDEPSLRREQPGCRLGEVLDTSTLLEMAGGPLRTRRGMGASHRLVGWRGGHQVAHFLPEQARWLAQVGATDPAARLDAVPGDRTTRQIGALLLRLDAEAEGLGKAPRRQEQHGADAAAEIHEASRRGLPQEFGAEPRRHEVVEGPAVAAHQLQDAPVAGEVAEVLAHTGPQVRPIVGRGGPRPRGAPACRTARPANDPGRGRHAVARHVVARSAPGFMIPAGSSARLRVRSTGYA